MRIAIKSMNVSMKSAIHGSVCQLSAYSMRQQSIVWHKTDKNNLCLSKSLSIALNISETLNP